MTDLAQEYMKDTGIEIELQGGGATRGIHEVASGSADIGGSCRYHIPYDRAENKQGFEPVAWDALAVIVHKENPISNITSQQIRDVYEGKITNWKQLGGRDTPIKLFTRKGKISGVGRSIRKLIFADYDKDFNSTKSFKSSGPLEKELENDPDAIGITGISSARLRDVKILKLNDVYPDYGTIRKGRYELYRPLYIVYNPASSQLRHIKDFIKYAHSRKGREIMKENGVVPYMEALNLIVNQIGQERQANQ